MEYTLEFTEFNQRTEEFPTYSVNSLGGDEFGVVWGLCTGKSFLCLL